MLILETKTINGQPIWFWEVRFMTIWGLLDSLEEAVALCLEHGFYPQTSIRPVCVAVDKDSNYEVAPQS